MCTKLDILRQANKSFFFFFFEPPKIFEPRKWFSSDFDPIAAKALPFVRLKERRWVQMSNPEHRRNTIWSKTKDKILLFSRRWCLTLDLVPPEYRENQKYANAVILHPHRDLHCDAWKWSVENLTDKSIMYLFWSYTQSHCERCNQCKTHFICTLNQTPCVFFI